MGQELLHRGSAMDDEDVIAQLVSGMHDFLAESALLHVHAASMQLNQSAEPRPVVDFASSAARLRVHRDGRPALRGGMRASQSAC